LPLVMLCRGRCGPKEVVRPICLSTVVLQPGSGFDPHALGCLARIGALFRRAELAHEPDAREETIARGELALDLKRFSVSWRGQPVPLTLTEFWMVHALARHPGHVKNREQLMREANLVVDDGTITSHVKRVRRKFQALDANFEHIETAYGMGYRWRE